MADQYAEYELSVDCPHCGEETPICGRALYGSGIIHDQFHRCEQCKARFTTKASIDIGVKP